MLDGQEMTKYILDKLENIDSKVDKIQISISSIEAKNEARDVEMTGFKNDLLTIKTEQANIKSDIANLKQMPTKTKAEKWDIIVNYIFKGILVIIGGILLWVICSGNLPIAIKG